MKINDYPNYIDERFRINFVKKAEKSVFWITPKFSKEERDMIKELKVKLSKESIRIFECKSSKLNDKGYCFSLVGEDNYINIQLLSNSKDIICDSLLVVDSTACYYNYCNNDLTQNAIFFNEIDNIKLQELEKNMFSKETIQINLFNDGNILGGQTIASNFRNDNKIKILSDSNATSNKNVLKIDFEVKLIQDRISKISISTPGIRTKDRNIDISNCLDLIGKPNQDIEDRLLLRWRIFGNNRNITKKYRNLQNELERIKERYTITINPYGKFILEKNKEKFELEIGKFREKFKHEAIRIVEQEINKSKLILEDSINRCYRYAKLNEQEFKTCTEMELVNIIETIKSKFPTESDVIETCDVIWRYHSVEKTDIQNKEFVRKVLEKINYLDIDLKEILEKIIKQ